MEIRARAPLRLGLAGGGTDLASYSSRYGGLVFNAAIGMYAYCTITPASDGKIRFIAPDRKMSYVGSAEQAIPPIEPLILHKGVYNRIVGKFNGGRPLSFSMSTCADAPAGSGLGTSSTMVVAILEAFDRWLGLGLSEYEKAELAYDIERVDLGLAGGKQDQYSAVFGGFNLMEFKQNGSVIINRLRMERDTLNELECSLLLFYSGRSRSSAEIISRQIDSTTKNDAKELEAMHALRQRVMPMKDALVTADFPAFTALLRDSWEQKKRTASIISNPELETIIAFALDHGAQAVKVSGAGGGGFIMILVNPVNRQELLDALKSLRGTCYSVKFSKYGAESWVRQ